jgi:hypothetical protein
VLQAGFGRQSVHQDRELGSMCAESVVPSTGGIKTVSRFNLLLEGETEAELAALRARAQEFQRAQQQLDMHASKVSVLQHSSGALVPQCHAMPCYGAQIAT